MKKKKLATTILDAAREAMPAEYSDPELVSLEAFIRAVIYSCTTDGDTILADPNQDEEV